MAFVLAMVVLFYLARLDLPARRAERAVLLTTIFPFAFFFGVVYTESAVPALHRLRASTRSARGAGCSAALCGALATATRVNGILMLPALAWIAWRTRGPDRARSRAGASPVSLLVAAAASGAYSLYIYRLSGNPFEWAASIQRWGYYPGRVAAGSRRFAWCSALVTHPYAFLAGERMAPYDTLNGLAAFAVRRRRCRSSGGVSAPAYGLFMAGESVAAAVVGSVRRAGPLLCRDVPVLHLACHARARARR